MNLNNPRMCATCQSLAMAVKVWVKLLIICLRIELKRWVVSTLSVWRFVHCIDLLEVFVEFRFSCAARASQNGARLEFHGERRVWDGKTIRKLKGKSALYLVMEDEVH